MKLLAGRGLQALAWPDLCTALLKKQEVAVLGIKVDIAKVRTEWLCSLNSVSFSSHPVCFLPCHLQQPASKLGLIKRHG